MYDNIDRNPYLGYLSMSDEAGVNPDILKKCQQYSAYVEAKLGFRNHWYPTLFSDELAEGEFRSHPLLGDRLLLSRVDGKVLAVRDRCLHHGPGACNGWPASRRSTGGNLVKYLPGFDGFVGLGGIVVALSGAD